MELKHVRELAETLLRLDGVVGVGLGGSRGLGIADARSDYDFVVFRQGGEQVPARAIGKAIEALVGKIVYPQKGNFIQAEADGHKLEVFQADLAAMSHEIGMARQGKFRWVIRPLFPHGDLSTRLVSHLVFLEVLGEKDEALSSLRAQALPFPHSLKNSLVRYFLEQASYARIHAAKVRSGKDFQYLMALVSGFVYFTHIVVFALNDTYPVLEKGGERFMATLKQLPPAYAERCRALFATALAGDGATLDRQMAELLDDLQARANKALGASAG